MTLKEFINERGTSSTAKALKVTMSRVSNWKAMKCLPDDRLKMKIVKLSGGKVTYAEIIEPFFKGRK